MPGCLALCCACVWGRRSLSSSSLPHHDSSAPHCRKPLLAPLLLATARAGRWGQTPLAPAASAQLWGAQEVPLTACPAPWCLQPRSLGCRLWHWLAQGQRLRCGCQVALRFRAGSRACFTAELRQSPQVMAGEPGSAPRPWQGVCVAHWAGTRQSWGPTILGTSPCIPAPGRSGTHTSLGVGRDPQPRGDGTWRALTPALPLGTSRKPGCHVPFTWARCQHHACILFLPASWFPPASSYPLLWCGHVSITQHRGWQRSGAGTASQPRCPYLCRGLQGGTRGPATAWCT